MGAPRAPFGTRMTVNNLTPSRIGIMASRRTWSNASVTGLNVTGVSLGNSSYVIGVCGRTSGAASLWASAGGTTKNTAARHEASAIEAHLRANNVLVSVSSPSSTLIDASRRQLPSLVRSGVHYYNTEAELEALVNAVTEIAAQA